MSSSSLLRLFPLEVARSFADHQSRFLPVRCIFLFRTNHLHVLSHRIHNPPLHLPLFLFPGSFILNILLSEHATRICPDLN